MKLNFGAIAFVVGLVLAVILALVGGSMNSWATWVLAVLGLIVGLLNVTGREAGRFLLATVAFVVTFSSLATVFAVIPIIGTAIATFFQLMVVFIAPATAVVAISSLFAITKN